MSFIVRPNCHVKIWKNGALPPGPPAGAPTYDGDGQLLIPWLVSGLPSPWRHRIALAPSAITLTNADINSLATQCWVEIVDDTTPDHREFWKIVDMSVSSQEDPATPGNYIFTAIFYTLVLSL